MEELKMFGKCGLSVAAVFVSLAIVLPVSSTNLSGAMVDFAELSLVQGGFTYYTAAGGGEFGFSSDSPKLLTLQSGGQVVAAGVVTEVIAGPADLVSDDSAGGEVNGTLWVGDNQFPHSLRYMGYLYSGGQAPYDDSQNPQLLMVAQATGRGEIAEVPDQSAEDKIQVQFPMEVIDGGLFDGSAGHELYPTFTTTYTFQPSKDTDDAAPVDLSKDLSFGSGDSTILITPEPVSVVLLGLGSLGLLRARRRS